MPILGEPYKPLKNFVEGVDQTLRDVILRVAGMKLSWYLTTEENGKLSPNVEIKPQWQERIRTGEQELKTLHSLPANEWQARWEQFREDESMRTQTRLQEVSSPDQLRDQFRRCKVLLERISTWGPQVDYIGFQLDIVESIQRQMTDIEHAILTSRIDRQPLSWEVNINSFIRREIERARYQLNHDREELAQAQDKLVWARELLNNLPPEGEEKI